MKINLANIKKAKKILDNNDCVGIPTETVYGLAANAYSDRAVKKIFKLKNRPKKNPLIIHYLNKKDASQDVLFNDNFLKLYKKFCPGPITFVLKKNKISKISSGATANLNTVAIRFPNHSVIKKVLKLTDFPLAMPSANLSSKLSPVYASDVFEDFKKKVKIIIDGGKSKFGIESTVIDLTSIPKILRPGAISLNEIKNLIKIGKSEKKNGLKSPGMLRKHYSPGIPVILGKKPKKLNHAFIVFGRKYKNRSNYFNLSKKSNLKEAASNLYKIMRKIKKKGYKKIFVSKIPNTGLGVAINDRLNRASK